MIAVTVNDLPVQTAAIVERGRVLLPLRATATALGARVHYDAKRRRVLVQRGARRIVVRPRIIANRSYVPVRFVAEALGAVVGYSAQHQLVTIVTIVAASQPAPARLRVGALDPPDGARVATAYPSISAAIENASADRSAVHLALDAQDVSGLASFDGSTITYLPRTGLLSGLHTVEFSGTTLDGRAFSQRWSFETTQQPPADIPANYDTYGYTFYVDGSRSFFPGDWMRFTLIAPPGGSAYLQLCGIGYQYPLWNGGYGSRYEANVPAPFGYWIPDCPVTATYTTWTGETVYVPYPVYVGLFTVQQPRYTPYPPAPVPTSTPKSIRLPVEPRRPEPTPPPRIVSPVSRPTAAPIAMPTAAPAPSPQPVRTAIPVRTPRPRATG